MAGNIRQWLDGLGLARYAKTFEENELDLDLVTDLSDADLKDLGVTAMGHRKKLLRAINALSKHATPSLSKSNAAVAPREAPPIVTAERRQVTVLFCDLVGSTALSARLDPEEMTSLLRRYHRACDDVTGRFDGHVAKFLGDGVLVYFGWPQAHEDDAERAARAGLAMVETVSAI